MQSSPGDCADAVWSEGGRGGAVMPILHNFMQKKIRYVAL